MSAHGLIRNVGTQLTYAFSATLASGTGDCPFGAQVLPVNSDFDYGQI